MVIVWFERLCLFMLVIVKLIISGIVWFDVVLVLCVVMLVVLVFSVLK